MQKKKDKNKFKTLNLLIYLNQKLIKITQILKQLLVKEIKTHYKKQMKLGIK
jgi:hypothetical protein